MSYRNISKVRPAKHQLATASAGNVIVKHFPTSPADTSIPYFLFAAKDTTEFEKNLKAMGINPTNPQCKPAPGAGGMPPPFIPFIPPIPPIGGANVSNGSSVIVKEAENASSSSSSSSSNSSSAGKSSTAFGK